ncbi:protein kinase [Novymonas esmeraldas]|uniref:Protein kinase n=1 Tax=Novymonas esmeraldas TaxID=1808958 RepID=A0AAW0F8M7_9TRYP
MCTVLVGSDGQEYQIGSAANADRGSYAALFALASTYHAEWLPSPDAAVTDTPLDAAAAATPESAAGCAVLVTYIPLVSSLQDPSDSSEAAALRLVLHNIRLRRQVEHPHLRTLFDSFYTDELLCPSAPASSHGSGGAVLVKRRPGASQAGPSPAGGNARRVSDGRRGAGGAAALTLPAPRGTTALVVVEEFVKGCSLVEYAAAVAAGLLSPSTVELHRGAAVVACQVVQLLLHLHTSSNLQCRHVPLDCVHLDSEKGRICLRLPLGAAAMADVAVDCAGVSTSSASAAATTTAVTVREAGGGAGALFVVAPELRDVARYAAAVVPPPPRGAPLSSADVWAVGLLLLQLCCLPRGTPAGVVVDAATAERAAVLSGDRDELLGLLPDGTEDAMQELLSSCLDPLPRRRPRLWTLLSSAALSPHRATAADGASRTIIALAEAVAAVSRRENAVAPSSFEPRRVDAVPPQPIDVSLAALSLQGVRWVTPRCARDVFAPASAPPSAPAVSCTVGGGVPVVPDLSLAPTLPSPAVHQLSLAAATRQTMRDVTVLHGLYTGPVGAEGAALTSTAGPARTGALAVLQEEVRRSRQLPRDIASTTAVLEELAEHFAHLERADPELSVRLAELLLEGFAGCSADVAAVRESVAVADALMRTSSSHPEAAPVHAPGTEGDGAFEEPVQPGAQEGPRDATFNVAATLRAMPLLPVQIISSDRAANTSSVLYNSWLRKQRKKYLNVDGV